MMKFSVVLLVVMAGCCVTSAQDTIKSDDKVAVRSRCLSKPPSSSRCRAAKPAFYFDSETRGCRGMLYGGCPGDDAVDLREGINLFGDELDCKNVCRDLLCPDPLCMMECPQGFQVDERSCKICKCKEASLSACPQIACPDTCPGGYELDGKGCSTCTCKKVDPPVVAACQQMFCSSICANGYVMDSKGCQTCECLKPNPAMPPVPVPCPAIECVDRCPRGYRLDTHGCQMCDCIEPSKLCSPNRALCLLHCEHGFMLDQDGCDKCACAGPPVESPVPCPFIECSGVCPRGFKKDAQGCQTCECIKESQTCGKRSICAMYCEFGNKLDQDGCPLCACASEPERTAPRCSPVACNMFCPDRGFRKDRNGCEICECDVDPCQSVVCAADEFCVSDTAITTRNPHSHSQSNSQVYTVRCVKINDGSFTMMLTVVAVVITCCLTALITAIFIMACTRRNRHRANAIYKPLETAVHM